MIEAVLITTAGVGSRSGSQLNKGLISVANKPVLSHIVEKFPAGTRFVISLGYGADIVRQYLEMTYPDRTFEFVYVDPFMGPGASPTLSILTCKDKLQCPFIFITNDTLVEEEIPLDVTNWIGIARHHDLDLSNYRTVCVDESKIELREKEDFPSETCRPYIGLAAVSDFAHFWAGMEHAEDVGYGEANGLRSIISNCSVSTKNFTWNDTGNLASLNKTKSRFTEQYNVIDKFNEAIWFTNQSVIKYHADPLFIELRVRRAEALEGFIPKILDSSANLYRYEHVEGEPLTGKVNPELLRQLLTYMEKVWGLPTNEKLTRGKVNRFYIYKAQDRLNTFLQNFPLDKPCKINGVECKPATELLCELEKSPPNFLARWKAVIHGDLHLDNVLRTEDSFCLVDWRHGFSETLNAFDIHYDFAKLYQSLLLSYKDVINGNFQVSTQSDYTFEFCSSANLILCQDVLRAYVQARGYNWDRVRLLTALIFISNTSLQVDANYAILNYLLGRLLLNIT